MSLGVRGEDNRAEAVKAWHRLMADGPKPKPEPKHEQPKPTATVQSVIDGFLADAKGRVKPNTYATYIGLLKAFSEAHGETEAEAFSVATALAFVSRPEWGTSHRHNLLGSLSTAFKWAASVHLIQTNPLTNLKRPPKASRGAKAVVDEQTRKRLLKAAGPALRLLLTVLHETGARPSELARLTAQDVNFTNSVAMLSEHKTAEKTGKPRMIVLTPYTVAVLRKQAVKHPDGSLLRNARGGLWTKDGIGLAMRRACRNAGVKAIAYGYRHTYATDALAKGVPDATVAALLGHADTSMLHRHYSHLTARADVLRQAASRVR